MTFTIITAPQRSPEWFQARASRLTGSRAGDALSMLKGGKESAARRDYRLQLAVERLTGQPQDEGFVSKDMQRGIDLEPMALAAYEAHTGRIVRRTGFLRSDEHMAGASLDAHVGRFERVVEVKCPKSTTHLSYLRSGVIPSDYWDQCRCEVWISGATWCDFVSYDPRLPAPLDFFLVSVHRDKLDIPGFEIEAIKFLAEVETELAGLKQLINPIAEAA